MNDRDRTFWEAVGGVLVLVAVALLGYGLYEAAVTFVAVPILWPLLSTVGVALLGFRELAGRAQRRRQALEQHEREKDGETLRDLRTRRAVVEILHRGPYGSDLDGQRIGDAERDIVVSALHTHFSAGRLDQDEVETRITLALAAKTAGELRRLVADLPNEGIDR